jgi:hypothetical protein
LLRKTVWIAEDNLPIAHMKPNHKNSHMLSASFVHYQKSCVRRGLSTLSPFLKHLNTSTIAFIMFIAFAFLSTTRGKDAEAKGPPGAGTTRSQIVVDKQNDGARALTDAVAQKMSQSPILWQFVGRIINAFEAAFNESSLIEYARQEGLDTTDWPPAPFLNTSSQPCSPSKSHASR